jgi:hypothetical protein
LLLASALLSAAEYRTAQNGMKLPDPAATPGSVLTRDAHTVCAKGYAQTVRRVTAAEKNATYAEYGQRRAFRRKGLKRVALCCEVDHLISLELGGANDRANRWPQWWTEARAKDRIENELHRAVCDGRLSLEEAQRRISQDWTQALSGIE